MASIIGDPGQVGCGGSIDLMYQAMATTTVFHEAQDAQAAGGSGSESSATFLSELPGRSSEIGDVSPSDEQGIGARGFPCTMSATESTDGMANESSSTGSVRRVRSRSNDLQREFEPGCVTALESSIKNFVDKRSEVMTEPSKGLTFDCLKEAYDFYNLYAWESGFGIRYGKSARHGSTEKTVQKFVCQCPGKPKNDNSASARTDCRAFLRVHRSADNSWYITEHRA